MLYKKNKSEALDMKLFKNPTSEYRGTPFWAWNCELSEDELLWQIEQLKKMGYGGFHMHTRSGMATKYLSDDFMALIKSCTQKAKEENMLAWLYDEDRWPSGAAGGYVTKNPEFCQRRLYFTAKKLESAVAKDEAIRCGKTYLLAIFDIKLNEDGTLSEYKIIENEEEAKGFVRYAYVEAFSSFMKTPGWFNGGTYVDTLNKKAIEKFVEITHEKYKEAVGEEFGGTVPSIFTDEPQFSFYWNLPYAESTADVAAPWTIDVEETFMKAYNYSIKEKIPELFWELPNGQISVARYHFHDHICERFANAYADTCGDWCEENGIALTGHLYGEYTLAAQTRSSGEAMRQYRSYQIPGVDMLFNNTEYSTVKQAQSAAHQYGREGVMSELYGVTNWDFDFRGHKFQGDWQAALGVTVRVPHLSWVSMKGAAKRDYPATFNYQTPWYEEYSYIEDHYARLNTVLTRGVPCVNVGVIHPIESYWLHYGPEETTGEIRKEMDEKFDNFVKWMIFGTVDFDFISESSIPELCGDIGRELKVGQMSYSTIVVPSCETLRKTTVDVLNKFIDCGGKVIFAGDAPMFMDAAESNEVAELYNRSVKVPFERYRILEALSDVRLVDIKNRAGATTGEFICQMRRGGDVCYLFVAKANPQIHKLINSTQPPTNTVIKIKGEYTPYLLNTLNGDKEGVEFAVRNGATYVYYDFYRNDSLLLSLEPLCKTSYVPAKKTEEKIGTIDFKSGLDYFRSEDNVCLLDMAEYALDGEKFNEIEEILRIDEKLRKRFDWPLASGQDMQPWAMEKEECCHFVQLKFEFESKEEFDNICFCAEELSSLMVNGEEVSLNAVGYFVDKSIKKFPIPSVKAGKNEIIATVPFAKSESLEACYLAGDFDVILNGCDKTLVKKSEKLHFGDITSQGMPFYGANITYRTKINIPEDCNLRVNISNYIGALTKVSIDGKTAGNIVFAPYELDISDVTAGEHTIEFTLFGNRHNTFGALHNCGQSNYYGQHYWYPTGDAFCYEYNIKKTGILRSPVITMYK